MKLFIRPPQKAHAIRLLALSFECGLRCTNDVFANRNLENID